MGLGWEEFSSLTKTAIMRCFSARFAAPCWMVAKMFTSSVLGEKERKYSKKALWQLYGKAAEKENRDEDKRWYANHYTDAAMHFFDVVGRRLSYCFVAFLM